MQRAPRARLLVLALSAGLLSGCAPNAATVQGQEIKGLYDLFLGAGAVVFVIVAGLIGWSIVRYRARGDDDELPVQTRENLRLELVWWAIPTLLVLALFIATAGVLSRVDAQHPDPTVEVTVTGFQWQWQFAYAGTDVVITGQADAPPQLVLPVGEPISLDLVSADVAHSFWVPAFLMKRDVIPGHPNRIDLTIEDEGTYSGQCAEFCGLLHDQMLFSVRAVSPSEFATWLSAQEGGT